MKLVYSIKEIEFLNNHFKLKSSSTNLTDFITIEVESLLNRSPAMRKSYISCYKGEKNLQPGYLTEINICATLAVHFNLSYNVNNINEDGLLRHQYTDGKRFLNEYGGCGMSDIQFVDENGVITTIEVKEPLSLGGDYDLIFTEEGKLQPKIAKNRIFPKAAQSILDEFNATDSIFNYIGHNIPLTNVTYLKEILQSYIGDKKIDYIATYSAQNDLIFFPVTDLEQHIDFNGSEIRTAGKNKLNLYTPIAFEKASKDIGCIIDKDTIMIPKSAAGYRYARGSNGVVSGIKINPIFFFEIKDVIKEDEEFYYARVSKCKQLKQGMSVHLNIK